MSDTETPKPTAEQTLSWLDRSHPTLRNCPHCREDCSIVAITKISYIHVTCECDAADYPHLVEQLVHLRCLAAGAAVEPATRAMLESAASVCDRYKLGKATAAEIRQFLEATVAS